MTDFPKDLFTPPADIDADTLRNLGPLRAMAGIWEGTKGVDIYPDRHGPDQRAYVERIEMQPLDPQTNGPQLLYGLRYHVHAKLPNGIGTYHDQIGYWLWEPAAGTLIQTLSIPRGQIAMASGKAAPDATRFTVTAKRGTTEYGICSNPFLEYGFRTDSYSIEVSLHADGSWSYVSEVMLVIPGHAAPLCHRDSNRLVKVAEPTPNPLAVGLVGA